jgi:transposase
MPRPHKIGRPPRTATTQARPVYETDLTDAQWALLKPLLPPPPGRGRPRKTDLREVVNAMIAKIARDNPSDLLLSTDLRPGALAMYVNYPARDNYNFDAQDQSFAWLAALRDVAVDLTQTPKARHNLP